MVSGGRKPKYAENTVMIFDDNSGKMVLEFTFPGKFIILLLGYIGVKYLFAVYTYFNDGTFCIYYFRCSVSSQNEKRQADCCLQEER